MADLYEMSDEELEAAFLAAKEAGDEPANDADEEVQEEVEVEEIENEDDDIDTEEDEDLDEDSEDDVENEDIEEDDEEVEEEPEDLPEDEDSDDNETDDEDEDEADEESEEEDQTEEAKDDSKEEVKATIRKFKANGMEYEFTDEEIMEQFPRIFGQAMDYTKKTQAMKPWRKTIDAIETAKLSQDDLNLAIDVLQGNEDAIREVLKRQGIDALDLAKEDETNYKPNDYGRDEQTLAIQDVIDDISSDQEYAVTNQIIAKDWDDSSWTEMAQNPELIRLLHADVKSGVYQDLQPLASKLKLYDRGAKSDLEYYKEAAIQRHQDTLAENTRVAQMEQEAKEREAAEAERNRIAEVKAKQKKAKSVKTEAKARKAAAPVRKKAGSKKTVDYLDDSDEAFEEWYNKVQDRS